MYEIISEGQNKYFVVMENLFYGINKEFISIYDLKGSKINRFLKDGDVGLDTNFIIDFNSEPLFFKEEVFTKIYRFLQSDSEFLAKRFVVDYSLLTIIDKEKQSVRLGVIDYFRQYDLNCLPPPFDENGNKTGQWFEGTYEFGEWYFDLSGNPVFISPSEEGDIIGDLYDQNSEIYMEYATDQFGNLLPLILMTQDFQYFEFIPQMYYKFVYDSMETYFLQTMNYHPVDRERGSLNIVFIGHVDHGKSTLSGRILKNCGEVEEQEIRKYEQEAKENSRESWSLAYIMDTNEEERTKGITVECGKAHFQLPQRRFVLIDAPGHKNYVPNMITGACQADVAALVISARQGEFEAGFEGGQTQEHAHLAKALGVQHVICIVSKMDEVGWSRNRYVKIKEQMETFLRQDVGFQSIDWVPVNGLQNENIDVKVPEEKCQWFQGLTLFQTLNQCPVPARNCNGALRIPVLDKIKEQQGFFVLGKIESGTVKEDMCITVMPNKQQVQIQAIYNTKDQRVFYASAGENIKLKIKAGEDKDIERGFVFCNTDDLCFVTQCFIAEINILKLPDHKPILSQGYSCVLHIHTSVIEVEIEQVEAVMNLDNKRLNKISFLKSGQIGVVKISLKNSHLCLEKFEKIQNLGRFTLRDEEKTIGFGKVMKIKPFQY
ncbi:hypothetical protein IMG5_121420 [Ichthyophthirius multifiliis]|uniref:Tr-type G domain-containing protein n=1 Tax=Ichthyophthirius multifiliis TaxID=5932 RepID=G0QV55_ICHMU|nr:hypothetical protein IMG5_121420 [Ichthyophthirius multifiliis]EGR30896.1 hypothetical protein IMG5_121420 [Ichthyophthirius multifiliis]|eukprot:XP_004032483.1 hypothetical protein IMG5_121420 [Ichthyophthirius multifiliis]